MTTETPRTTQAGWTVVAAAAFVAIALRMSGIPTLNFSAMGGLAVLCGIAVRPAWLGLCIVLASRFVTDAVLELQDGDGWYGSMAFDYAAYAIMAGLGCLVRPKNLAASFGTGLLAASVFFVVSNFGVWALPHNPADPLYPSTMTGLWDCFVGGIPFARRTFFSDIVFTMAFVGILQAVTRPERIAAVAPSNL